MRALRRSIGLVPALIVPFLIFAVVVSPLVGGPPVEGLEELYARLYARVSPAVVGIESWIRGGADDAAGAYGTGVIIHPTGLVLTSITVVPPEARRVQAQLQGARFLEAERVQSVPDLELVLLRLRPPAGEAGRSFPFLPLGDSDEARVGLLACALGNAFQSIAEDDQVSFAAGAVSGRYILTEARSDSRYVGPAIETTAAVNDGMDGGPLVNSRGEIMGLLSLNFSRSRWLGTAIPINVLKPHLLPELGSFSERWERFGAYLGLELSPPWLLPGGDPATALAGRGPLVVHAVEAGSPAEAAGVKAGDRLTHLDGSPVASAADYRARFRALRRGERVKLRLQRGAEVREAEAVLWGRF